ncbi:cupin domain-containing protein [Stenotrophomonas tumulicola]|uniref:AraC family transcriptional regulator n=1 Tax=Stenotrophomonas tumulicola TaxID=1685415 RepID=A0A7W3IGN9_9GAMM|nr:AraC family transcriptional regulator [Stenotrophomonas tumulicola]
MIIQNAPADPLSDVLSLAGLRAACSVRLTAGGAWALRFLPIELKFNIVQRGSCWLATEGREPVELQAGDCFVVSRTPFVLASDPALPAVDAAKVFAASPMFANHGEGEEVSLLGGSVTLAGPAASELLDLLPPVIVIRDHPIGASPFAWLLDALDREWRADLAGGRTVCNDLLRLMFVHALRRHIDAANPAALGWLGGLRDPAIAAALRVIHAAPAQTWKLEALAAVAGMSRSAFAAQFKQRVGQAPVAYAAQWRMRVAAMQLLGTTDSVSRIAASSGFLSDAAFGVAFRRVHGVSPGRYRANARGAGT